jgi:hypothetical protein
MQSRKRRRNRDLSAGFILVAERDRCHRTHQLTPLAMQSRLKEF